MCFGVFLNVPPLIAPRDVLWRVFFIFLAICLTILFLAICLTTLLPRMGRPRLCTMSSLLLILPLRLLLASIAADDAGAAGSFRKASLWLAVASAIVSQVSRRA